MNTQTQGVQQVPLIQLLRRVPENAKLIVDSADGMGSTFHPVGRLCHEAAEALAQPAQEPVVFSESDLNMFQDNAERYNLTTAYPAPAREPLSGEDLSLMAWNDCSDDWNDLDNRRCWLDGYEVGARAIEKAHGIGE